MAFEDPSKLKIDLVVGAEEANQQQIETPVELQPATAPLSTNDPLHTGELESPTDSSASNAPSTSDASLTPWKNRFAGGADPKSRRSRIGSIAFKIFDIGTIALTIITILLALLALGQSVLGPKDVTDPTGISTQILLGIPVFLGFILYPLFAVRMCMSIASLKPKFLTFLRAAAPLIAANTMTVWGLILAFYAIGVATVFGWVRGLEPSISHQQFGQAMTIFTFSAAGLLQLSLILLLAVSIVIYHKFFQWIDKRTEEIHGGSMGSRKSGLFGIIAGALFGFCGLYTALAAGGPNTVQYLAISTLIWSFGILVSSLFFSIMAKFRNSKPVQ